MKLAASKLRNYDIDGSTLQWAHQQLTMILANGKFPPAFTLANSCHADSQDQSLVVPVSDKAI